MNRKLTVGLLAVVLLTTGFAFAQSSASQKATPKGVTFGVDGRFRTDDYNNTDETNASNDESRFLRIRTRPYIGVNMGDYVEGYARLGNEVWKRYYVTNPATGKSVSVPVSAGDIWFDNAYLNFKKLPYLPGVSLKIGRQDILKGDGFFLFTGRSGYGPREINFDAFILAYTRGKQKLELMGFWNPQNDDFYPEINGNFASIPTINVSGPTYANDVGTVQSLGAYYTGRQLKNTDIDGYFFFVKEYEMASKALPGAAPSFAGTYHNIQYQPDRHLGEFGGRVVQRFPMDIVVHANFTGQAGTQDAMTTANSPLFANVNNPNGPQTAGCATGIATCGYQQVNIRAWGFYPFATKYFPNVKTKPYVRVVSMLLSGQDPKNLKTNGNFDLTFSRWAFSPSPFYENGYASPLFTDEGVNNLTQELGPTPAYLSNSKAFGVEAGFTPLQGKVRNLQFILAYQHVDAFHPYVADPVHYYLAPGASFPTLTPGTGGGSTCTAVAPCFAPGGVLLTSGSVPSNGQFSQTGLNRYQMIKPKIAFVLNSHISGHVTFEELYYGDFYNKTWYMKPAGAAAPELVQRANTPFFRAEINYKFESFMPYHKAPKM